MMQKLALYFTIAILLTQACTSSNKEKAYVYSEIETLHISDFYAEYRDYCTLDFSTNFELNAVICSFVGDYHTAIDQATKREASTQNTTENDIFKASESIQQLEALQRILNDPDTNDKDKASIQNMVNIMSAPTPKELFAEAAPVLAVNYIIEKALDYHFTLINEAHYSSQNRSFSHELLKPLWDIGYRYLALETLGYDDQKLHERGYPIYASGFYTKDSNFGNLVRDALAMGYQLVTYEDESGQDGTLRERGQAHNIFQQTWEQDKNGKVLIHAGYSHIYEFGDQSFEPMGYQLKSLINQDILTIDQTSMMGFNDSLKQHQYYMEATKKFELLEPSIFLNNSNQVIVDPVNSLGIDIQVYHPKTQFKYGRPNWRKKDAMKYIFLSAELLEYEGHLIQALPKDEALTAVPVDQFVISEEKAFILKAGIYDLKIINCAGDLTRSVELTVD